VTEYPTIVAFFSLSEERMVTFAIPLIVIRSLGLRIDCPAMLIVSVLIMDSEKLALFNIGA
jgi:hypothetical protein